MTDPEDDESRIWPSIDEAAKGIGRDMDEPTEAEEDRMDLASDCRLDGHGHWVSR